MTIIGEKDIFPNFVKNVYTLTYDKVISDSGHRQFYRGNLEIWHLHTNETSMSSRLSLGNITRQLARLSGDWSPVRSFQQIQFPFQSLVSPAHHRFVRWIHHFLHLCQRKLTYASTGEYRGLYRLCGNQYHPWNILGRIGLLDSEITKEII